MKKLTLTTIADFTWLWNHEFFLEAQGQNYIWSDPSYEGGTNTIRETKCSYSKYLQESHISFGRDKGKHTIGGYCGKDVTFNGEKLSEN